MVGKVLTLVDAPDDGGLPLPDLSLGRTLFHWQGIPANDAVAYNNWADEVSTTLQRSHPRYVLPDGQVIEVSKRSVAPRIVEDGRILQSTVELNTKDPSGHTEWVARHRDLIVASYLHLDRTYAWNITMRLDTPARAIAIPRTHITWLQCWGPMGRQPPTFALQLYRGAWRIQCIGGSIEWGLPDMYWHDWTVIYKPSLSHGLLRVWMDGKLVHELTDVRTAEPVSGSRTGWAGQQRFGCYTVPTPDVTRTSFRNLQLLEMPS